MAGATQTYLLGEQQGYVRLGSVPEKTASNLGPLACLLGTWVGSRGWNLIAVPESSRGFKLLVRPITEMMTFTPVGALVPNRGGPAGTLLIPALHYDLRVADAETNEPMHIENGMWLLLNDPHDPAGSQVARLATIPHGDSVLAIGPHSVIHGPPSIPDNSAFPDTGKPAPAGYTDAYLSLRTPGFLSKNPNQTLQDAIKTQKIVNTVMLSVSTVPSGGIVNIPFVVQHANLTKFTGTLWIETVQVTDKTGAVTEFEQLQYSQQADLHFLPRFDDPKRLIMWPHISINTLLKQ
jgi:hypothetical protein